MPGDIYEKRHLANLKKKEAEIRKAYEKAIHEISVGYNSITWDGKIFMLKDYPALLNRINAQVKKLHAQVYAATVNGIEESWDLSNEKNNVLVDKRLAGMIPTAKGAAILYDPNIDALDEFIKRKTGGLNLSQRVWNTLDGYRTEMEAALGVGISEGRSANELASDLRKYLNQPDKLFRRVRSNDGTLKLSRAAKNYSPGAGVYRSSFANAKRLARNEQNISYRLADIERWKTLPFVKGYRIVLSNAHPTYDICDELNKSIYPKDFVWSGWHVNCLCHMEAVQMTDAEYDKFEDSILGIGKAPKFEMIEAPPVAFTKWVTKNKDRINNWGSVPYWVRDNQKFVKQLLK